MISIRELRDEDYSVIKEMEKLFLEEMGIKSNGSISDDRSMEEDYVLLYEDRIIGFCCMVKNPFDEDLITLEELFILSEFRGKKLGRAFIEYLLIEAKKKYKRIILVALNKDLIEFYNKWGFEQTKFPEKDNAIEMNLYLI